MIEVHRYELRGKARLNSASDRIVHPGALIRIDGGIGCLHPWPELGDEPLDLQLEKLQHGEQSPLLDQAIRCARMDGGARREGRNLFEGLAIPRSHWTATVGDDPASLRGEGFDEVKLKTLEALEPWVRAGFRVRIDLNETGECGELIHWWLSLAEPIRDAIDFLEDPIPWQEGEWRRLKDAGIPLAADRDVGLRCATADWLVLKPALGDVSKWFGVEDKKVIITSYMDHAIGQMWAAFQAARFEGALQSCGLLTHDLFEPDPFFSKMEREGARLLPPPGTGLGFDEELESLAWEKL